MGRFVRLLGLTLATSLLLSPGPLAAQTHLIAQAPEADNPGAVEGEPLPAPVPLWWWLLPAAMIVILIWAMLGRRRNDGGNPQDQPLPDSGRPTTVPAQGASLTPIASRPQSLAEADRDRLNTMEAAGLGTTAHTQGLTSSEMANAATHPPLSQPQADMPTVPPTSPTLPPEPYGMANLPAMPRASAQLHSQSDDGTADSETRLPNITAEPMDELVSAVFSNTTDSAEDGDIEPITDTSPSTIDSMLGLGEISADTTRPAPDRLADIIPETVVEPVELPGQVEGETPLVEPMNTDRDATAATPSSSAANVPPSNRSSLDMATLATVDDGLPELPDGYSESRIVLMPRDPQWAYAYWDIPNAHKEELRNQGGRDLALRLYDVSDVDLNVQAPHNIQQYYTEEMARSWYLPIPVSDRDYIAELGYLTPDGRWLVLARSAPAHIPPVFPSDWIEDQFLTLDWSEDLRGKTFATLIPPGMARPTADGESPIHDAIFARAGDTNALRVAGSLFGSMQQVPASALSSFAIPSGLTELPGAPVPNFSGLTMSGLNMSGAGFSADFVPPRPRKFWLVADAELIVYGATEPDATVTIGGKEIELAADGTFHFRMSFQDGELEFPIQAVASDGEQTRDVEMDFKRETPQRNTNTKDEADLEWLE